MAGPVRTARFGRRLGVLLAGTLLVGLLWTPPAQALGRAHPFPPQARKPNPMRAPGLLSSMRPPLGRPAHTGYRILLRRPIESTTHPLLLAPLAFYRTVMSPVNGSNSDLAPVPSLYSVQAVQEYGVLLGAVLVAERLFHEPSVIPLAPRFREDGREFFYDPLRWNVAWLPGWLRGPERRQD